MKKLIVLAIMVLALAMLAMPAEAEGGNYANPSDTLRVTVHAPPPNKSTGIKFWDTQYDQEFWTHGEGGVTKTVQEFDPESGEYTTSEKPLEPGDYTGDFNMYVCTLDPGPWSITMESSGFDDAKSKHYDLHAWVIPGTDISSGKGQYGIPAGSNTSIASPVTIYTADPGECPTYMRQQVTVPATDGSGDIDIWLEDVQIDGGFALANGMGKTVAEGVYPTSVTFTLVQ